MTPFLIAKKSKQQHFFFFFSTVSHTNNTTVLPVITTRFLKVLDRAHDKQVRHKTIVFLEVKQLYKKHT